MCHYMKKTGLPNGQEKLLMLENFTISYDLHRAIRNAVADYLGADKASKMSYEDRVLAVAVIPMGLCTKYGFALIKNTDSCFHIREI